MRTLAVIALVMLAGCAAPRPYEPPPVAAVPDTRVHAYPAAGQSDAQFERDRYECHLWAVRQTGFDPSSPQVAPHQQVQVVAGPPPGSATAAGAATGAIMGAALSRPRDAGASMVFGAIAGAIVGSAADNVRDREVDEARRASAQQGIEQRAAGYRRAMGACLQGRQYTIG